jgi:5-methylcytosine-specific restriction endonuclease McrA
VAEAANADQGHGALGAAAFAVSNQPALQLQPQPGQVGSTGTGSSPDVSRRAAEPARVATGPAAAASAPAQRPRIEPLAAARYKVQFTASEQLVGKLRQAQELLRRQVPDGDPAVICERALDLLLESLMKKRFALSSRRSAAAQPQVGGGDSSSASSAITSKPVVEALQPEQDITAKPEPKSASQAGARRQKSRYIPASVRRQVAERDGLRCTYVGPDGKRCERRDVEFHHLTPFARGGQHKVEEITLRCRAHNAFQAEQDFGAEHVARRIRQQRERAGQRRVERERAVRAGAGGASAPAAVQAAEENS